MLLARWGGIIYFSYLYLKPKHLIMKKLLCLLLIIGAINAHAQTSVGIQASYNGRIGGEYGFNSFPNVGLFVTSPIYKKLHFNTGLNFLHTANEIAFYYEPWYMGAPENTASGKTRRGILEIPAELLMGIYTRPEAKMKAYLHAGYAIGTSLYNRSYYYDNNNNLISSSKNAVGKILYHNICFELEFRWTILKKYTTSFFICNRNMAYKYREQKYHYWSNYLGTGIRLGLNLPKKAK